MRGPLGNAAPSGLEGTQQPRIQDVPQLVLGLAPGPNSVFYPHLLISKMKLTKEHKPNLMRRSTGETQTHPTQQKGFVLFYLFVLWPHL